MLPKRLKSGDQILEYKGIHSRISVDNVTAARMYVAAQKSSKQFQTPLKLSNPHGLTGSRISFCELYKNFYFLFVGFNNKKKCIFT